MKIFSLNFFYVTPDLTDSFCSEIYKLQGASCLLPF